MKKAFTMVELIFVIVVIGILAAIAVPKLAATRDDAVISKAMATVGALRSAIATERQKRILRGDSDLSVSGSDAEALIEYGLGSGWTVSGETFSFNGPGSTSCSFTIDSANSLLIDSGCDVPNMSAL